MSILLKNVRVINSLSAHHDRIVDIYISKGIIQKIGSSLSEGTRIFDLKGQLVSPGWIDLNANFNDPGFEFKEDLFSGLDAAAHGGFTDVCVNPNANPVIQNKSDVEYLLSKASGSTVNLHPIAALSKNTKGEELSEMHDLHQAGAVAFSDGNRTIDNSELLLKGLQYAQKFDGLLINHPTDRHLSRLGQMHEGKVSTGLGLKGIPSIAESVALERDLGILRYTGGKLHISQISCAESVKLIQKAKNEGLNVTCDVSYLHLVFTDEKMPDFDTNYKVMPPFRSEKDRQALIRGVKSGIIDAIVSAHQPQDEESKKLEFDLAEFGVNGIQTVFPALLSISDELPLETAIESLSVKPASIIKLKISVIEENKRAQLTILDPNTVWTLNKETNKSKSVNNPYFNASLTGKVTGIIQGNKSSFF